MNHFRLWWWWCWYMQVKRVKWMEWISHGNVVRNVRLNIVWYLYLNCISSSDRKTIYAFFPLSISLISLQLKWYGPRITKRHKGNNKSRMHQICIYVSMNHRAITAYNWRLFSWTQIKYVQIIWAKMLNAAFCIFHELPQCKNENDDDDDEMNIRRNGLSVCVCVCARVSNSDNFFSYNKSMVVIALSRFAVFCQT